MKSYLKWLTSSWNGFFVCLVGLLIGFIGFEISVDTNLGRTLFWLGWFTITVGGIAYSVGILKTITQKNKGN